MSHSGNTIARPIGLLSDIGTLLGTNDGDLGRNILYGNIKTWAKFKPYRSTSLTTLGESARGDSPYYFGMSWPQFSSPSAQNASGQYLFTPYNNDTASSARNAMNGWQYLRPRGRNSVGGNEWFRAGDFEGYYHDATEPIVITSGSIAASTALSTETTIAALRKETFNAGEIDFSTMQGVKNYYYCLVGYRVVGDIDPSTFFVISTSSKISNGLFAATIVFNGTNFNASRLGNWDIFPCLCSVGGINFFQTGGSLPSATYIPLPCTKKWTANVQSNQRTAVLNAQKYSSDHNKVTYRLRIYNDTGSTYTFNDVTIWLMHNYHTPSDVRDYDEELISLGNIEVPSSPTPYDTGYVDYHFQYSSLWPDLTLYATCSAGFDRVGPIMPLTPST